jgi:hypothetical protein
VFSTVFPSGVFAFVLGQVALVAGGVTFVRGFATGGGPRGARLALVMRGAYVVLACAVAGAVDGVVRAATDGGGWGVDAWVALALLVCGAAATGATVAWTRCSAGAASASPEAQDIVVDIERAAGRVALLRRALPPVHAALDRAPRLTASLDLRRHPWRFALAVSIVVGLAAAIGHGITEEPTTNHLLRQLLAGAIIAGVEALAAFLGFVLLGGYLGLRSDIR